MLGALKLPAALASVALLAGCGGDGDEEPADDPVEPQKAERPQKVHGLPHGWSVERNEAQGFSLGAPPGWRSADDCLKGGAAAVPTVTILCSPDKLVTLSVSADRTDEAFELKPGEFATRTMTGLADSYDGLDPGKAKPFKAHYPGATVEGRGEALGTGVRQDVSVVVLRRDHVANFTAVIAANADKPTQQAVKLAEESLTTLRSAPVGAPSG